MNDDTKKEAADIMPTTSTPIDTVAQTSLKINDKKKIKYTMRSTVKTLSVKCYAEQLPAGWDATKQAIQSADKSKYQILAIEHNRDYNNDSIWTPSYEKSHFHFIIRMLKSPEHIQTLLSMLGIVYRTPQDDALWQNHGVETCRDFSAMANYLTHDTEQAQLDGKTQYQLDEIVSNLSIDEIKSVRDGYVRVSDIKRVASEDLEVLDGLAYALGLSLEDFNEWYGSLPFSVRAHAKMKTIKESYQRGIEDRTAKREEVNRLCVFIQGSPNIGKTYAAKKVLEHKHIKTYSVSGGGSGKFDKLKPTHQAIILDDYTSNNLLNMSDNYMTEVYRRNNNNPIWCGNYFIVTSNLSFQDWLAECKIARKHFEAMYTRFYVLELIEYNNQIAIKIHNESTRGTASEVADRKRRFDEFLTEYMSLITDYYNERTAGSPQGRTESGSPTFLGSF